ncbi:uncharacterized protein LOC111133447 [Crassostrea virginica]
MRKFLLAMLILMLVILMLIHKLSAIIIKIPFFSLCIFSYERCSITGVLYIAEALGETAVFQVVRSTRDHPTTQLIIMIPSKVAFLFMIATSWFCLITASQYEDVEMLAPPERPSSISNIEELRRYIKELNMYYLILARPRYGRSVRNFKSVQTSSQS